MLDLGHYQEDRINPSNPYEYERVIVEGKPFPPLVEALANVHRQGQLSPHGVVIGKNGRAALAERLGHEPTEEEIAQIIYDSFYGAKAWETQWEPYKDQADPLEIPDSVSECLTAAEALIARIKQSKA